MFSILIIFTSFQSSFILSDFSETTEINNWVVLNDGVMGGKSEGEFAATKEGYAIFNGDVSLRNNGGFTSIRKNLESKDITGAKKISIKLKGDEKNYQFRVKSDLEERHSYKYEFETSGKWEVIEIELNKMSPTFRGYRPNLPNYSAEKLSEICFLIGNKKNESFELLIDSIWLE